MELTISIIAAVVSVATFLYTILITYRAEQRDKKQDTLDALNVLQEQVFDHLNNYTYVQIREIAEKWKQASEEKAIYLKKKLGNTDEFWKTYPEYEKAVDEYRKMSGYLARIEHFALGVNTGIYDAKVAERAATVYLVGVYRKLQPILAVKNKGNAKDKKFNNQYHNEFSTLIKQIQKIENKNQ